MDIVTNIQDVGLVWVRTLVYVQFLDYLTQFIIF